MNLDCTNIKTIEDVTDQVDYEDEDGGGAEDGNQVSCGQDNGYNELKNKYKEHFSNFDEEWISTIMCKCCNELKPTSKEKVSWSEYYECMKKYAEEENGSFRRITKAQGLIKKLDELIKKDKISDEGLWDFNS